MASYKLVPLAKSDLVEIGLYTAEVWGYEQAEKYLNEIDQAFTEIAEDNSLGTMREDIKPDLFMYKCMKHLIFFRRTNPKQAEILRILHEKRDHKQHL